MNKLAGEERVEPPQKKSRLEALKSDRGMPADHFHLITTGHLMATEREENGWKQMMCMECQEKNLDLIWHHDPITEEFLASKKMIPGTVWGEDVTAICPCCSFPWCTHKQKKGRAA